MRALQFWILLLCSVFISCVYLKQISLSRELTRQQRDIVDAQKQISDGAAYENAWKQLAMHVYQASHDDPALIDILKAENVDVRPAGTNDSAPATSPSTTPGLPSAPVKAPALPTHSSTP